MCGMIYVLVIPQATWPSFIEGGLFIIGSNIINMHNNLHVCCILYTSHNFIKYIRQQYIKQ